MATLDGSERAESRRQVIWRLCTQKIRQKNLCCDISCVADRPLSITVDIFILYFSLRNNVEKSDTLNEQNKK